MFDFAKLAKFNLAKGSHKQPNENGDICINEAAIIAAGFEYKAVGSWKDCPPCFSKVIAQYAINLNDRMPDHLRNELLKPFVIQLSGTADTKEVELARVNYLVLETVRRINAYVCRKWMKREDFAKRCEAVKAITEIKPLMKDIRADAAYAAAATDAATYAAYAAATYAAVDAAATDAATYAAYAAATYAAVDAAATDAATYAAYAAATYAAVDAYAAAAYATYAAYAAATATAERRIIFTMATEILAGAIALGKHQTLDDIALVNDRIEKAKRCKIAA